MDSLQHPAVSLVERAFHYRRPPYDLSADTLTLDAVQDALRRYGLTSVRVDGGLVILTASKHALNFGVAALCDSGVLGFALWRERPNPSFYPCGFSGHLTESVSNIVCRILVQLAEIASDELFAIEQEGQG